jgi:hypothetical protein
MLRCRDALKHWLTAAVFPDCLKVATTCQLIADLYEWDNEIATVPTSRLMNPQFRERAKIFQRGKKTLLSFAAA